MPFWVKFIIFFSKNSEINQAAPRCIERSPQQRSDPEKKFHMPKTFHRTLGMHCFCQNLEKFRFQCLGSIDGVVSSERSVNLSSARAGLLRTTPPPYPECCKVAWPGASVGGNVAPHRRHLLRWQNHPWRSTGGHPCLSTPTSTAEATRSLRVSTPSLVHSATQSPQPERRTARSLPPMSPVKPFRQGLEVPPKSGQV